LPITLIEAFHSTLEETIYSDLILLVVDASEPINVVEKKLAVCLETIERIGASGVPIITAMNKIDLIPEKETRQRLESLKEKTRNPLPLSAKYGTNIESLKKEILKTLKNYVQASFTIPLTDETMSFVSGLFKSADVQTIKYTNDSIHAVFEAIPWFTEKVRKRVDDFKGEFKKI
jgi:GTP-binding protein HflX